MLADAHLVDSYQLTRPRPKSRFPGKPSREPKRPRRSVGRVRTPYLTGLAHLFSALGVFVGAWMVIILLGEMHLGFAKVWPEVLILVIIIVLNVSVRLLRFRRRRALGLTKKQRRWRVGVGPPPPSPSARRNR